MVADGKKLTKKDASGNVTQWGVRDPVLRLPLLAVPGALTTQNGAILANADGTKVNFDEPEGRRGRAVLRSTSATSTR